MPSIQPSQLRSLAQTLAQDGKIGRDEVKQLVNTALGDEATLAPELKTELQKILVDFGDALETGSARAKLQSFLDIKDASLQAKAWRLEGDDGVISADDAKQLLALANADGAISKDEKFSLAAMMLSSAMSAEARKELASVAGLVDVKETRTPNLAIPDNNPAGAADKMTVAAEGKIADLSIDVDIDHTWKGDLTLKLIAPDGSEVLLHNKSGRSEDNIKGNYPGTLQPAEGFDKLIGLVAKGEWTLHAIDSAGADVGKINSWSLNLKTVGEAETPPPAGEAKNLDPTGKFRPTHLTADGIFLADPSIADPKAADIATGLFHMASLVDDVKGNVFVDQGVTLAQREKVYDQLRGAIEAVPADGSAWPTGLTEIQALQQRSSSVTVLLSLIESLGNGGDDFVLKQKAFKLYTDTLKAEQNPTLKDSMVFQLMMAKDGLTPALRDKVDDLAVAIAPTSPPYEEWFKDGNRTLNISWTCGQGEEFFSGTLELLEGQGFTKEDPTRNYSPIVMVKKATNPQGEEITIRMKVGENHNSVFEDMDEKDVHIVGYDGHSDIGRAIPASLRRGDAEEGKKLIFYGLCAGKDNLNNVRGQYPNAQVITTFNSSYFNTKDVNGKKVMSRSENFNVLMQLIDGAVKNSNWDTINNNIRQKAILYPWSHVMPGGTNYISPVHTLIRAKVLDSDHDGQADYLDKLVTFDTHKVATDTAREFTAIEATHPVDLLDGTVPHLAAMALNTATGYNTETQKYKKQNIIGNGYFKPEAGDTRIVKFERTKIEGQDVLLMQVNANYAHMSVEALRAVAHYAFIMEMGGERNLSTVDKKLMALTFAAFSINYDEARWSRDSAIWNGLLETLNLPRDLPMRELLNLIDEEHHDYSGNMTHVRKYKESLSADALAALEQDDVGVVG